ncbi:thylakoid rhodanese-like protein [Wolffia australiana]
MEVLNAAQLSPVSIQKGSSSANERRAEPRKLLPFRIPQQNSISELNASSVGKAIGGGLAFISSVLSSVGSARSLTYEEALGLSVGASSASNDAQDVDIGGAFDGIVSFGSENALLIGGGALALAIPLVLSQVFKSKPKAWSVESAKSAFAKLSEDSGAQLLDIREIKDIRVVGSPDLRGIKKKSTAIAYTVDDKPGFLNKLSLKFKDPENTTLFVLDKFDGNSEFVAELATANGFKAAVAIKDGAEGPRGWQRSGLPWLAPKKGVDFGDLGGVFSSVLGDGADGLPATLGLAAATGLGFLAFSEIETVLQLLGSAAIFQFATKKLLFAEDRKVTLKQLDEFLNTKVAPQELVDEIKTIGKALLPVSTTAKASLPAPVETIPETSPAPPVEKPVSPPEAPKEPEIPVVQAEAVAEPPQEVNAAPVEEVKAESAPVTPRSLSPYPYYPDLKPPSSPCPAQP